MDKKISITVDVEEWFHTKWFNIEKAIIECYDGEYPKTDIKNCVERLIELFDKYDVNATFFVLGETAEIYPDIINLIKENNHEIACHGYYHNKSYDSLQEFRKDIRRFKKEIEDEILGYRSPNFTISKSKLRILYEEGFVYDSSVVPCWRIPGWYGNKDLPLEPFKYNFDQVRIMEFPIAVCPYLRLPGGGGWYLRNVGYWWTKNVLKFLLKETGYAVIYIHPWEISHENPRLRGIPFHVFRNTGAQMYKRVTKLIKSFEGGSFMSIKSIIKDEITKKNISMF